MTPAARILVVDDDPALRDLLCAYLTDTGFVVDLAGDGDAMRRAMQEAMPDAIVLDLMLPNEDGLVLTRELRTRSAVPILMLSARGEEIDRAARRLLRADQDLGLSGAEYDLLKVFIERPNRVLSRDLLLDLLKGYERDPYDRTVDIRVARLRRKIEPDPANPVYVRTVRGAGYLFNPHGAES